MLKPVINGDPYLKTEKWPIECRHRALLQGIIALEKDPSARIVRGLIKGEACLHGQARIDAYWLKNDLHTVKPGRQQYEFEPSMREVLTVREYFELLMKWAEERREKLNR